MQLGEVRDAGQRREVGADREHLAGGRRRPRRSARARRGHRRRRPAPRRGSATAATACAAGLERLGELVLAELEAADPGQDQGVVGGELPGGVEGGLGRRVEGRIGRLADPLEEGEPEVALGVGVGRVGGDEAPGAGRSRRRSARSPPGGGRRHGRRRRARRSRGCRGPVDAATSVAPATTVGAGADARGRAAAGQDEHDGEGHDRAARPGVHAVGTGRPSPPDDRVSRMTA